MKCLGLNKSHKLCSLISIDALFMRSGDVQSALAYPMRVVWRVNPSRKADVHTPKFLISVPRRRRHHAVDRVKMRRRIREAYRLNRAVIFADIHLPVDMAFIYVADKLTDYKQVDKAMIKCLTKIAEQCSQKSQVS